MHFDDRAATWDDPQKEELANTIANHIRNALPIRSSYTALEFGAGTGLVGLALRDAFSEITLIDTSVGMIKVAQQKITEQNITTVRAIHTDLQTYVSTGKKVDVIFASMALHHIKNIPEMLQQFYAVLNNTGYVCIVDLNEDDGQFHEHVEDFDGHDGFNQEALRELCTQAGFTNVSSKTIYHGAKVDSPSAKYSLFMLLGEPSRSA